MGVKIRCYATINQCFKKIQVHILGILSFSCYCLEGPPSWTFSIEYFEPATTINLSITQITLNISKYSVIASVSSTVYSGRVCSALVYTRGAIFYGPDDALFHCNLHCIALFNCTVVEESRQPYHGQTAAAQQANAGKGWLTWDNPRGSWLIYYQTSPRVYSK